MARCGVYTLLTKYANPISETQLIMVARKTYYHPYNILWTEVPDISGPALLNVSSFGYTLFVSCVSAFNLTYTYVSSKYNITFGRCENLTLIRIKHDKREFMVNFVRVDQGQFTSDTIVSAELDMFINKIQESSLSEIIEHHLHNLIKLII